jgi:hypothetical protein
MPKYSDYREWENYREQKIEETNRLRRLGFSTYGGVPLIPEEGLDNWYKNIKENKNA